MNILDAEECALRARPRILFALAHLPEREHSLVACGEHVRAKHLASRVLADRLAGLLAGAHANGAEAVRDVGLLAAGREAVPRLGRDGAIGVVDQEVPAPAGSRPPPIGLVVERVD